MSAPEPPAQPHAPGASRPGWTPVNSLELTSRRAKARKLRALLGSWRPLAGARVLEVGAGAGVTGALLAEEVGDEGEVVAVDVEDLRRVEGPSAFALVEGTALPFGDDRFDVVISNLVIEHVGGLAEQQHHLAELARVLAPGGVGYLALPNRWAPVEPHFGVPFLTWVPARWRTPVLRRTGRAQLFDIRPLSYREAKALVARAGLNATDRSLDAMRVMAREEEPWVATRLALRAPAWLVRLLRPVLPTYVFELRRADDPPSS